MVEGRAGGEGKEGVEADNGTANKEETREARDLEDSKGKEKSRGSRGLKLQHETEHVKMKLTSSRRLERRKLEGEKLTELVVTDLP